MDNDASREELADRLDELSKRIDAAIAARDNRLHAPQQPPHGEAPAPRTIKNKAEGELERERSAMSGALAVIVAVVSVLNYGGKAPLAMVAALGAFAIFGLLGHAVLMAMARSAEQGIYGHPPSLIMPVPPLEASEGQRGRYAATYFRFEARVALYGAAALALAIAFGALPSGSKKHSLKEQSSVAVVAFTALPTAVRLRRRS